jgi:hypothetical protein
MAKYDAVDRLMRLATEKASPSKVAGAEGAPATSTRAVRDAEEVLEAEVSRSERGAPASAIPPTHRVETTVPAEPQVSSAERGRQLLGALRPFLPAVGGALRFVDHGAVQAVARLLPLLGTMTGNLASNSPKNTTQLEKPIPPVPPAPDVRQIAIFEELNAQKQRLGAQDEQIRHLRESLERTVVEQGSLSHLAHQLAERVRLLTAAVVILGVLAIAQAVLLAIFLRR